MAKSVVFLSEEEKRKRLNALGIGGVMSVSGSTGNAISNFAVGGSVAGGTTGPAVGSGAPKAPKTVTPRYPASQPKDEQVSAVPFSTYEQTSIPRKSFELRAGKGQQQIQARRDEGIKNDLEEYYYLRNQMGPTKFDQRLEAVDLIYRSYMRPYQGEGIVWDMMRSPYTTAELEMMAQQAYPKLFSGLPNPTMIAPLLSREGFDPSDPKQAQMGTLGLTTFGNWFGRSNVGPVIEKPIVTVTELGKLKMGPRADDDDTLGDALRWMASGSFELLSQFKKYAIDWPAEKLHLETGMEKVGLNVKEIGEYTQADWREYLVGQYGHKGLSGKAGQGGRYGNWRTIAKEKGLPTDYRDPQAQQLMSELAAPRVATIQGALATGAFAVAGPLAAEVAAGGAAAGAAGTMAGDAIAGLARVTSMGIKAGRVLGATAGAMKGMGEAVEVLDPMIYAEKVAEKKGSDALQLESEAERRLSAPWVGPTTDPLANDSVYQQWLAVDAGLSEIDDPTNIVEMQEHLQELEFGTQLEADGIWDYEWRRELLRAYSNQRRENIELQQQLMASGFADKALSVNGNLDDPKWQEALGKAQGEWQRQTEFAYDHPEWSLFLDALGVPLTKAGWDAALTRYAAHGVPQAIYKSPIELAKMSGGLYNAVLAGMDLKVRKENDDAYQNSWHAIRDYVARQSVPADAFLADDVPFDQVPEEPSEAYVRWAMEKGYLKDDPNAQQLYGAYMENVTRLLDPKLYSANYISLVANTFHANENDIMRFQAEHPELVHETNIMIDLALAVVGPKVTRGARRSIKALGNVKRTSEAFEASGAMSREVNKVFRWLNDKGDLGLARRAMGGTDAAKILTEFFRKRGGTEAQWLDSTVLSEKVVKVRQAAMSADPIAAVKAELPKVTNPKFIERIVELTKKVPSEKDLSKIQSDALRSLTPDEYRSTRIRELTAETEVEVRAQINELRVAQGQRRLGGTALDKQVAKTMKTRAAEIERTVNGEIRDAGLAEKFIERKIQSEILHRQTRNADVFGKVQLDKQAFYEHVRDRWAAGDDIFPHMQDRARLHGPSQLAAHLDYAIASVESPLARRFLTSMVAWGHHAPIDTKDINQANTSERVFDGALAVSGDVRWAAQFRTRFVMAQSKVDFNRLANDLAMKANERFRMGKANGLQKIRSSLTPQSYATEAQAGGFAPAQKDIYGANDELLVKQGDSIGAYKDPTTGEQKYVVADTVYERYQMALYREALWAPYRLTDDMSAAGKALLSARNVGRGISKGLNSLSTPLRQWTVALGGPVLFQKHSLVDSGRSILEEGPESVIFRRKYRHKVDTQMEELSPQMRDDVMTSRKATTMGEYLYNMHNSKRTWTIGQVFDKNGKARRLNEGAEALRRMAMGDGFQAWAKGVELGDIEGGRAAVSAWLDTPEGTRFLKENGHLTKAEAVMKLLPEKYKGYSVEQVAKAEYMDGFVREYWETLNDIAPQTFAKLREMAVNGQPLSVAQLKEVLKDNYAKSKENPVLSVPIEYAGWWGENMASRLVGVAMKPNKWNRGAVFDKIWSDNYGDLRGQGVAPDKAARISSTIAEIQTSRVHFDLTNALAVEAKHRWFAWFATKHRLYGTYLAEIALKRPMIAGAALEVQDWLADRAAANGDDEYAATKLTIHAWGHDFSISVAPMFWLADYPLESGFGAAMEWLGAEAVNLGGAALGSDSTTINRIPQALRPTENPFGWSISRIDAPIKTVAMVLKAHSAVGYGTEATEEKLTEYLDSLSEEDRNFWYRAINKQMALAASRGVDMTPLQAFNSASVAGLAAESWNSLRVVPMTWKDQTTINLEHQREQYFAIKDADARYDYLEEHPALQWSLNIFQDPVKEYHVNKGFEEVTAASDIAQRKLEAALDDGTILVPGVIDGIIREYDKTWAALADPLSPNFNEHFEAFVNETADKSMLDVMSTLFPLVPPDAALREGKAMSNVEREEIEANYHTEFLQTLADNGLEPSDTSQPLYKVLKLESDMAMAEELGAKDKTLTWRQESVAKFLSRGGVSGIYKRDQFLALVKQDQYIRLVQKGLSMGRATKNNPFMLSLTPEEKAAIGWNPAPDTLKTWKIWANAYKQLFDYQRANGISATSTVGKQQWAGFTAAEQMLAAGAPEWNKELQFSRVPLYQRLQMLGVGDQSLATTPRVKAEAQGWDEFLSTINELHTDMAHFRLEDGTVGIKTLQGKQSKVLSDAYLRRLEELRKKYPEWWETFRRGFTLSDFGFYWHLADESDKALWWGNDPYPDEETPTLTGE